VFTHVIFRDSYSPASEHLASSPMQINFRRCYIEQSMHFPVCAAVVSSNFRSLRASRCLLIILLTCQLHESFSYRNSLSGKIFVSSYISHEHPTFFRQTSPTPMIGEKHWENTLFHAAMLEDHILISTAH